VGGTTELATAMVSLCYEAKNWEKLNEIIVLLSKRRAQLKQAVTAMVQQASAYVDELDEPLKRSLIETLRNVSEGKMCAALAVSAGFTIPSHAAAARLKFALIRRASQVCRGGTRTLDKDSSAHARGKG
jgi:hypothetical protein